MVLTIVSYIYNDYNPMFETIRLTDKRGRTVSYFSLPSKTVRVLIHHVTYTFSEKKKILSKCSGSDSLSFFALTRNSYIFLTTHQSTYPDTLRPQYCHFACGIKLVVFRDGEVESVTTPFLAPWLI